MPDSTYEPSEIEVYDFLLSLGGCYAGWRGDIADEEADDPAEAQAYTEWRERALLAITEHAPFPAALIEHERLVRWSLSPAGRAEQIARLREAAKTWDTPAR